MIELVLAPRTDSTISGLAIMILHYVNPDVKSHPLNFHTQTPNQKKIFVSIAQLTKNIWVQ